MADKVNLTVDQGATFSVDFIVKDANNDIVNLTDYTGAGQLRRNYASNSATSFTIGVYSNGTVRASLTANQTAILSPDRYVYDLQITNGLGEVTRIVEGIVTITPEVTK